MDALIGLNSIFIIVGVTAAQAWIVQRNSFLRGALILVLLVASICVLLLTPSAPVREGPRGPEVFPLLLLLPIMAGCVTFLAPGAWLLRRYGHEQIPFVRYTALLMINVPIAFVALWFGGTVGFITLLVATGI